MNQALEIRILIVLHFGDWAADGVGLGHLLPTEVRHFVELSQIRPVQYKNKFWRLSHSDMEIEGGIPIMRLYFQVGTKLIAGVDNAD